MREIQIEMPQMSKKYGNQIEILKKVRKKSKFHTCQKSAGTRIEIPQMLKSTGKYKLN